LFSIYPCQQLLHYHRHLPQHKGVKRTSHSLSLLANPLLPATPLHRSCASEVADARRVRLMVRENKSTQRGCVLDSFSRSVARTERERESLLTVYVRALHYRLFMFPSLAAGSRRTCDSRIMTIMQRRRENCFFSSSNARERANSKVQNHPAAVRSAAKYNKTYCSVCQRCSLTLAARPF
jgi:hypothetical protein